jgi:hypothetical protein
LRAKYPWRRFWTRREGRKVTRRTPSEALAEKERVCMGVCKEARERMEDSGEGEERVGVVRRPNGCGWKRVGVERREEKARDDSIVEDVSWGIWGSLDRRSSVSWMFGWSAGCCKLRSAYLLVGVRMADIARVAEGMALERRQNIVPVVYCNRDRVGFELMSSRRGVGRQKIKRGAAEARTRLSMSSSYGVQRSDWDICYRFRSIVDVRGISLSTVCSLISITPTAIVAHT